jgi:hypothetical protein
MKTPDPAEVVRGEQQEMKSESPSPHKTAAGRGKGSVGIPHLPMEWMDPMSWRLPSGKALAEFALQTGFLAPLMMRPPKLKKMPCAPGAAVQPGVTKSPLTREKVEEAPGRTASFRQNR